MAYLMYLLDTPRLEVCYDPDERYLYNTWRGPHDEASVREGGSFIMSCLRAHRCRMILSDHTHLRGDWDAAAYTLLPARLARMADLGVQRIAWVASSNSALDQSAIERACRSITQPCVAIFSTVGEAQRWLRQS